MISVYLLCYDIELSKNEKLKKCRIILSQHTSYLHNWLFDFLICLLLLCLFFSLTNSSLCASLEQHYSPLTELISIPSHYEKSTNLHLQKFGQSQKPLLNQNNLSLCLTFFLLHCSTSHTTSYLPWLILETTLKSKQPFTLSYILSPPLQPRHIPNASGHCLPIQ